VDDTGTLSIREAAEQLGVSEKTVRRHIAAGKVAAYKVQTSQGFEWRVQLDNATVQAPRHDPVQLDSHPVQEHRQTAVQADSAEDMVLLKALELADRLQQENVHLAHENVQLAGQLGFLQAKVQSLEEQIRLLTTEQEPEATELAPEGKQPWWKRLFS
jgi:excisionase family DNA binding protein